jgi:23S rRNA (uridine2552-2'-O)-methyltransferase
MEPVEGVEVLLGDFHDPAVAERLSAALEGRAVDLVVSDMAPNLSGVAVSDAARVSDLVELAVEFSVTHLQPRGALVCKVFHGSGYSQLVELFKRQFRSVKAIKPKASRGRSAETFLVGQALRSTP